MLHCFSIKACTCFTIRDKVVPRPRRIDENFTALKLLYFKDLIVNGLYSSYYTERFNGNGGRCKQRNLRSDKIQTVLFSRVFDLQNSIYYRRLQYNLMNGKLWLWMANCNERVMHSRMIDGGIIFCTKQLEKDSPWKG